MLDSARRASVIKLPFTNYDLRIITFPSTLNISLVISIDVPGDIEIPDSAVSLLPILMFSINLLIGANWFKFILIS